MFSYPAARVQSNDVGTKILDSTGYPSIAHLCRLFNSNYPLIGWIDPDLLSVESLEYVSLNFVYP